ncbi:MAG: hypothetical protein AB7I27_14240 [Bacteriovoracaceae bacterium]
MKLKALTLFSLFLFTFSAIAADCSLQFMVRKSKSISWDNELFLTKYADESFERFIECTQMANTSLGSINDKGEKIVAVKVKLGGNSATLSISPISPIAPQAPIKKLQLPGNQTDCRPDKENNR